MKAWTMLKMDGRETRQEHENELAAHALARKLWKVGKKPFELRIYRRRHMRGDTLPTEELLAVYRREAPGLHTHLSTRL
jgi:hypothetical protein